MSPTRKRHGEAGVKSTRSSARMTAAVIMIAFVDAARATRTTELRGGRDSKSLFWR